MKTCFALTFTLIFAGCVNTSNSHYKALDTKRSVANHIRLAEKIKFPSVTLTEVTLEKAAGVFYVCNEDPPEFQNTIILHESVDSSWAQQKVILLFKNVSFASLCDQLCIQTGSVWWADGVVHIEKKTSNY
jgi:hypothetical protein